MQLCKAAEVSLKVHDVALVPNGSLTTCRNLEPGGTLALVEAEMAVHTDGPSLPPDSPLELYFKNLNRGLGMLGCPDRVHELEELLHTAGFVDIAVTSVKTPWGEWGQTRQEQELGKWAMAILATGLSAYAMAMFTRILKLSSEENDELIDAAYKQLTEPRVQMYEYV